MAPTYSRAQNRRQNRTGLVDHDIYEGLPVKQWRRDFVTVAPPPSQENTSSQNDIWAIELPWGMPKDSHMLPQHSQDLLRAARSGKIYKRPAPVEEEEADPEIVLGDKPEKKDDDLKDKGFTAKAWKQIPRQSEATDVEYLAKRRKGLITVPAKGTVPAPTLIKATVKRTDAVGNEYVQDVVVPQGQHVEGEVLSQTVIPGPNPVAVQPTPPRRKGPVSKKKNKGPGRGRKKKQIAPTSAPTTDGLGGVAPSATTTEGALGPDGVKIETDENSTSHQNEDTEMGDGSNAASDNDDGDEGDEGDDSDDDEGSDIHASPSKGTRPSSPAPASLPTMKAIPEVVHIDTEMSGTGLTYQPNLSADQEKSDGRFGSPLKQVALTTSALNSPLESSAVPTFPEPEKTVENIPSLEQAMQEEVVESAPTELPLPPPEPTIKEEIAAVETLREEEEEEEMLLDIVDKATLPVSEAPEPSPAALETQVATTNIPATDLPALIDAQVAEPDVAELDVAEPDVAEPDVAEPDVAEPNVAEPVVAAVDTLATESDLPEPVESKSEDAPKPESVPQEEIVKEESIKEEPSVPAEHAQEEEDDDFPDLLGGLEASLS